jgi:hypothetical protein
MSLTNRIVLLLLVLGLAATASATTGDERIAVLTQVERARLALEHAKAEYERAQAGRNSGILSDLAFRAQETAYRQAELDYEQAVLLATGAEQRVSVDSAVKTRASDGRTFVSVRLSYRLREHVTAGSGLHAALARIESLTVSLQSENGVVISVPYEARLYDFKDGETRTARFELLKDVEVAQITLRYNGQEQRVSVYLLRDAHGQEVALSAAQPSLDVEAGATAVFNLTAERLSSRSAAFRLNVTSLPPDVGYDFTSDGGAHVSQVGFTDTVGSEKLQLNIRMPREIPEAWIDRPLPLTVTCVPAGRSDGRVVSGALPLEVVPRGTAKLKLQLSNLFEEVRVGQSVVTRAKVSNSGTRPVRGVTIAADVPLSWKAQVQPAVVPLLREGADTLVQITVTPPTDAAVGEYEARLRPNAGTDTHGLQFDEQVLRIRLAPHSQGGMVTALLAAVVLLLGGVGYLGIRLSRT